MQPFNYLPEKYWDEVAMQIRNRNQNKFIAGDEEPYYLYKRKKFLELFHKLPLEEKKILEIGCGPGGNLTEVIKHCPRRLVGVDISKEMVSLATEILGNKAEVIKIDGTKLPFETNDFEILFTSTVLQHITDDFVLKELLSEMARVCSHDIYIFERIEKRRKAISSNVGRTIGEYKALFGENNFELVETSFPGLHWSWMVSGAIRKTFNRENRREGEKQTSFSNFLQRVALKITKPLDKLFPVKRDLALLHFKKQAR